MSTGEYIVYWILALTLMAGFWLVFGIVATEFKRREWRLRGAWSTEPPAVGGPQQESAAISEKRESEAVRGFDSPELFRKDALERIKRLDEQIAAYLSEAERSGKSKA